MPPLARSSLVRPSKPARPTAPRPRPAPVLLASAAPKPPRTLPLLRAELPTLIGIGPVLLVQKKPPAREAPPASRVIPGLTHADLAGARMDAAFVAWSRQREPSYDDDVRLVRKRSAAARARRTRLARYVGAVLGVCVLLCLVAAARVALGAIGGDAPAPNVAASVRHG
jgi:hypothetical protein